MPGLSGRSVHSVPSRRIPSSRFRSMNSAPKQTPKPAPDTLFKDRLAGTGQAEAASRQDRELRLEGRRLGRLRGGKIRITCGCGHSGDVPVAALVARHGDEVRVRDATASMRCGNCGVGQNSTRFHGRAKVRISVRLSRAHTLPCPVVRERRAHAVDDFWAPLGR